MYTWCYLSIIPDRIGAFILICWYIGNEDMQIIFLQSSSIVWRNSTMCEFLAQYEGEFAWNEK